MTTKIQVILKAVQLMAQKDPQLLDWFEDLIEDLATATNPEAERAAILRYYTRCVETGRDTYAQHVREAMRKSKPTMDLDIKPLKDRRD